MTTDFQVTTLRLAFRAERRARIDRGERDLESEVDSRGIRHDLGKRDFTPLRGENATRARLIVCPWNLLVPVLSTAGA